MSVVPSFAERISDNIEKVVIGKRETIDLAIVGLLCQGHLLIEDVPGVGKTMLARSLARSLGCAFSRIQFTPGDRGERRGRARRLARRSGCVRSREPSEGRGCVGVGRG